MVLLKLIAVHLAARKTHENSASTLHYLVLRHGLDSSRIVGRTWSRRKENYFENGTFNGRERGLRILFEFKLRNPLPALALILFFQKGLRVGSDQTHPLGR